MNITQVLVVISFLIIGGLIIFVFMLWARHISVQQKIHSIEQENLLFRRQLSAIEDELHEIRSGNIGLGSKVKELIYSLKETQNKQQDIAMQDPKSRFYNQAAKLVESGASIEELMRECDIPHAEAELLYNLHQK
ncbi:MAG: hypothetical protein ACI88A_001301 [Paraglaciecola sp.]|jgi:hypothetical protein